MWIEQEVAGARSVVAARRASREVVEHRQQLVAVAGITAGGGNLVASYSYFPPGSTWNTAVVQRHSLSSGVSLSGVSTSGLAS